MEEGCFGHFVQKTHPPFEHMSIVVLDFGTHLLASADISLFYQFCLMKPREKIADVEGFLPKPTNTNLTKQT